MTLETTPFEVTEYIEDKEDLEFLLNDALETGNVEYIADILGTIAKAKGMGGIAAETQLNREQLYRSFSKKGNPTLKTFFSVLKALDLTITVKKAASSA